MLLYVYLGILKKHLYFRDALIMFGEDYEKEN